MGRVDDVVNVSGHRLSTAEIEAAIIEDPIVAECAVVGFNDDLTGQAVAAFVVLKNKSIGPPQQMMNYKISRSIWSLLLEKTSGHLPHQN
ncbi:AMP-binding enzyme C-terminal domain family protein [Saccharomyces cerevisiae]|nr:AMP-binding enzyme C-terminal domain family protein [Saccharomyces cerevisiae]